MNTNSDFDRIAQTWLQDGPTERRIARFRPPSTRST